MPVPQLTVQALAQRLRLSAEQRPALLDVRLPDEHASAALPDSLLIPLHELRSRQAELEPLRGRDVVVYCHHGVRSLQGASFLRSLGFEAASLSGGIDAWSVEIDPLVPRY